MILAKIGAEMVASEEGLSLVSVRRARRYVVFPLAIRGLPTPVHFGCLDESLTRFFADPKMVATELDESIEELAMRLVWEEVRVGSYVRFDVRSGKNLFNMHWNRFYRIGRVFGEPPPESLRDPNSTLASVLATMQKHHLRFAEDSYSVLIADGLLGWWK